MSRIVRSSSNFLAAALVASVALTIAACGKGDSGGTGGNPNVGAIPSSQYSNQISGSCPAGFGNIIVGSDLQGRPMCGIGNNFREACFSARGIFKSIGGAEYCKVKLDNKQLGVPLGIQVRFFSYGYLNTLTGVNAGNPFKLDQLNIPQVPGFQPMKNIRVYAGDRFKLIAASGGWGQLQTEEHSYLYDSFRWVSTKPSCSEISVNDSEQGLQVSEGVGVYPLSAKTFTFSGSGDLSFGFNVSELPETPCASGEIRFSIERCTASNGTVGTCPF